jgi:hypothetical protein
VAAVKACGRLALPRLEDLVPPLLVRLNYIASTLDHIHTDEELGGEESLPLE